MLQSANQHLGRVTTFKDGLAIHVSTMEALIAAGEARRMDRSGSIQVQSADFDGKAVGGTVKGVGDNYRVKITLAPRRAWSCTCPDKAQRGRQVGPCKHTLALAKYWLNDRVDPAIRKLIVLLTQAQNGLSL